MNQQVTEEARSLTGKHVVVSGATGDVGQVACQIFCERGASVLGVDVDDKAGTALEARLRAAGHDFGYQHVEVADGAGVEALARTVRERWGGLDVLYNTARPALAKGLFDTTDSEWADVQTTDLKGVFVMTRGLAPLMKGRAASIINSATTAASVGHRDSVAHSAAMGGVVLLTKACAMDLGPQVRVNVIVQGPLTQPGPAAAGAEPLPESVGLLGRSGTPAEVVSMAAYLAGDESSFVTGAALPVDGGWTTR